MFSPQLAASNARDYVRDMQDGSPPPPNLMLSMIEHSQPIALGCITFECKF